MIHTLLLAALMTILSVNTTAQTSCCSPTATQEFATLGSGMEFQRAHLEPSPRSLSGEAGQSMQLDVPNAEPTTVWKIKANGTPEASVIVIHEWWGVNDHIHATAQKLHADLNGKADVIVIDLYDGLVATTRAAAASAMQAADEQRIRAILTAVINSAETDRIGTVGWCFGGGWSLQTALMAGEKAKACVMYYGMPEKDVNTLKGLNAPVLGIFASQDKWISPEVVDTFQANMMSAERMLKVKMYDADHAFANPSNPQFDVAATQDAWENTIEFLTLHLLP